MSQERFDIEVSGDSKRMQVAPFSLETRSILRQPEDLFGSEMALSRPEPSSSEEEKERLPQEEGENRQDGFEPFLTDPQPDTQRFINIYGGNYSQQMELNRLSVEELMRVGAYKGQIILTSLPPLRKRSLDINADGSATAKRRLFWGEKVEDEETIRPYQVLPIPQGWRVEINDQEILDDLTRQESRKPLEKRFVAEFNRNLRSALFEILRKEKTGNRDTMFKLRIFATFLPLVAVFPVLSDGLTADDTLWIIGSCVSNYVFVNMLGIFSHNNPTVNFRNLESPYEIFMPQLEIDRWARGAAYLTLKGRNLARLSPQGSK